MSTPTSGWTFTFEHSHCKRCYELAQSAKALAQCTGSVGATQESRGFSAVDPRGELLHAGRADRT